MVQDHAIARRSAALAAVASLVLLLACDDDSYGSTPTAPAVRHAPPSTEPTGSLPVTEPATPGTYERTTLALGRLDSQIVFESSGAFRLEYGGSGADGFGYPGTYARQGDWYLLDFEGWSTAGPWEAYASFGGKCVDVRFNMVMVLSDFEDGRFCR